MIYWYECPVCHELRMIMGVPEEQKDSAAPMCWEHEEGIKMIRVEDDS